MPKPVFAVACQRAITSDEGLLTLVDVIEKLTIHGALEADQTLPQDIYLVTHWRLTDDDKAHGHEFRFRIVLPSGKRVQERVLPAYHIRRPHTSHRHIYRIRGFPIGHSGTYAIQVSARTVGAKTWGASASFPIDVEHLAADRSPASPG